MAQLAVTLAQKYVWGPGDGAAGVDELIAQYASPDRAKAWWALQDAGGDLAALAESPPGSPARVVGQWTYDAYGAALTAEHLWPHPFVHAGHKGLFFDRLDVGVATAGSQELPRLVPYLRIERHRNGL